MLLYAKIDSIRSVFFCRQERHERAAFAEYKEMREISEMCLGFGRRGIFTQKAYEATLGIFSRRCGLINIASVNPRRVATNL